MDEHVQTKVPADLADRIETFQEGDYMTQSEAVRKLLRDGLDANEPLDEEPDGRTSETGTQDASAESTAAIEQAYRFSKQLADAGMAAVAAALGAWTAVAFSLIPADLATLLVTAVLTAIAIVLTFLGLALAVTFRVIEAAVGLDADPQLRRLDLRRVVTR